MISKSALKAAYPLAELVGKKGFALEAIDETPVAELVNASTRFAQVEDHGPYNPETHAPVKLESPESFVEAFLASSEFTNPNGVNEHDEFLARTVEAASKAVAFNLDMARNRVNPMLRQVVEATQQHMDSVSRDVLTPLEIVPFNYAKVWGNQQLLEMVAKYKDTTPSEVKLVNLAPRPQNLLDALKTGVDDLDRELAEVFENLGEAKVGQLWDDVFGQSSVVALNPLITGHYTKANIALLAFFFARRLAKDIPDDVNMSLPDYNTYIATIQAQCGRAIAANVKHREGDIRIKRLVLGIPTPNKEGLREGEILVNGDLYPEWLKKGGSPEALMGAVVESGGASYQQLIDEKARFEKHWQRTFSLLQSTAGFQKLTALIGGLQKAVTQAILEAADELKVVENEVLHARLAEELAKVTAKDLDAIWCCARRVVCRVLFPHTDVEKILVAIDVSSDAHPELEVREAALLATVDYVTQWVFKLVQVVKV